MAANISRKKISKTIPRKAEAYIQLVTFADKKKVVHNAGQISRYLESFSYTDVASGESDEISMTLCNIGMPWASKWMPKKGQILTAQIAALNWAAAGEKLAFDCGTYTCDDISIAFPEAATATVSGVSIPERHAFRSTKRSKTWKGISLWEIANTIAKRYGMKLSYSASPIGIRKEEQSDTDDCAFLFKLCGDYGLGMKVYRGKIAIFDIVKFEQAAAVAKIKAAEILDGDYNSTLSGTYTGAKMQYTVTGKHDKKTEKTLTIGKGERWLSISEKAESYNEAQLKAYAKLREENRKAETLKFTTPTIAKKIWAGSVIEITGAGYISGRWFVDKATHTVSASDGYTVTLETHRARAKK